MLRQFTIDRRSLISGAAATAAMALIPGQARAFSKPAMFDRAMDALSRHGRKISHTDRIGIADFNVRSGLPRFHIVDVANGRTESLLVAHGSGSDPGHCGYLQSFSNRPGSNATSDGAYVVTNYYEGKYGRSMRLEGLDATNDNAMGRAIVVHPAWYVTQKMADKTGQVGRSQGCFAFPKADIATVLEKLGPGRMIFAGR